MHLMQGLLAVALFAGYAKTQLLPRSEWNIAADSQELRRGDFDITNVLDGDAATIWHTQFSNGVQPYPHRLTINLGGTFSLSELRYTPRQDRSNNGNIGQYEVYTRNGRGDFGGAPVASGTFADNGSIKTVALNVAEATAVMLVALTEAGERGPWATAAEINLAGQAVAGAPPPPQVLAQSGFTVTADSEELARGSYAAANVADGDDSTIWHTNFSGDKPQYPHSLTIELDGAYSLSQLQYTPRQDRSNNGNIGEYEVYTHTAGGTFGDEPAARGTFNDNKATKMVPLDVAEATAVRLVGISEAGGRGPWATAAEINLVGRPASSALPTPPSPSPSPSPSPNTPVTPEPPTCSYNVGCYKCSLHSFECLVEGAGADQALADAVKDLILDECASGSDRYIGVQGDKVCDFKCKFAWDANNGTDAAGTSKFKVAPGALVCPIAGCKCPIGGVGTNGRFLEFKLNCNTEGAGCGTQCTLVCNKPQCDATTNTMGTNCDCDECDCSTCGQCDSCPA